MVFEWARWLKHEKTKIKRVRSTPSSPSFGVQAKSETPHKFSFQSIHETFQHALGYGSWWSVLLIFTLVVMGVIGWINAWLVDQVSVFLRKIGIMPSLSDSTTEEEIVEILLRTASDGDVKLMNKLINAYRANKALLETQSSSNNLGDTPIHIAARFGHSNIVIALLDAGVDIEVENRIGETPLAVAAESGHTAVAAVLLSRGASDSACVKETALKPIHLSAMFDHVECARLLLVRRPESVNWRESIKFSSPLHLAVGLNHADMARFLLSQTGIDVSLKDVEGQTALDLASAHEEIKLIFQEFGY